MTSTKLRASTIAAASRVGSRTSVLSGESVRATTFMPEPWGEAMREQVLGRAAVGLVAPAVGDGPDRVDGQRHRHVTGHGVGIDEQDRLVLPHLERGGEVGRHRGLADAALRVEDGDGRGTSAPARQADLAAVQDRTAAVIDGLASDAHRLDPPADRIGGERSGEVLVVRVADIEAGVVLERSRRDDGEGRDRVFRIVDDGFEGTRLGLVDLAVEHGQGDCRAGSRRLAEIGRIDHLDDVEAGTRELSADRCGFCPVEGRRRRRVGPCADSSGLGWGGVSRRCRDRGR